MMIRLHAPSGYYVSRTYNSVGACITSSNSNSWGYVFFGKSEVTFQNFLIEHARKHNLMLLNGTIRCINLKLKQFCFYLDMGFRPIC